MHVDARLFPPAIIQTSTYNKGPFYLATAASLVSFALLIFLLRVYTRTRVLRFFALDDWLMLVAVFCIASALAIFGQLSKVNALGAQAIGTYLWAFALLSVAGISLIKLSIIFYLLRVVQRTMHRPVLYAMMAVVVTTGLLWFTTILFQCIPIRVAWEFERKEGVRCILPNVMRILAVCYESINATTDLLFALLPTSMVWSSHRIAYTRLFLVQNAIMSALGIMSTVAAIIRLTTYTKQAAEHVPSHVLTPCIWSVVEMTTGATAACLPPLKPLLTTVSDFFSNLSSHRRSSTKPFSSSPQRYDSESPPPSPYPQSYSTPTFLSLPRPKPTRYHDHTSDLDFDLYATPATTRSRAHSRNPSNLTVFTNFTSFTSNFTVPPFDRELDATQLRAYSKGTDELERPVELELSGTKSRYAVSVTSGCESGESCEGSEEEKTIRRIASEASCRALGGGGIMRTTEVMIS